MSDNSKQPPRTGAFERWRADVSRQDEELQDWLNTTGGFVFLGLFAVGFLVFFVINLVLG